jgi:hypothetical protein
MQGCCAEAKATSIEVNPNQILKLKVEVAVAQHAREECDMPWAPSNRSTRIYDGHA